MLFCLISLHYVNGINKVMTDDDDDDFLSIHVDVEEFRAQTTLLSWIRELHEAVRNILGRVSFIGSSKLTVHPITCRTRSSAVDRGRAMLHINEYFAKSLKITQGHSK